MKRILVIFLSAFVLNVVWENAHVFLYSNYMGGEITEFILLRASLFDALLITLMLLPFVYIQFFKNKSILIIGVGIIIAVVNEWYGLGTGRWAYNEFMPIIFLVNTGLTPTLQLGILGYVTFLFQKHLFNNPEQRSSEL